MTVGVLTLHASANPGAFLQAYSTVRLIKQLGYDAAVINYTRPVQQPNLWQRFLAKPERLLDYHRWLGLDKRNRTRAHVTSRECLATTRRFLNLEDLASARWEAVVVGSDVVWDYVWDYWQRIEPPFGRDPVYFGEGLHAKRLIAFAPSCGTVNSSTPVPEYVRKGLAKFDRISVRDEATAALVEQVLGRRPEIIVDPTFHLDLTALPESHEYPNDYLLVYSKDEPPPDVQREIAAFARSRSLRIVAVCFRHRWADENHIGANPFEWISRIRCARYFYTGTFHGTVFALKMGKPFATHYNPKMASRTRTMIDALSRQDRLYDGPGALARTLDTPWDVAATHQAMSAMSERARLFLADALPGTGSHADQS